MPCLIDLMDICDLLDLNRDTGGNSLLCERPTDFDLDFTIDHLNLFKVGKPSWVLNCLVWQYKNLMEFG